MPPCATAWAASGKEEHSSWMLRVMPLFLAASASAARKVPSPFQRGQRQAVEDGEVVPRRRSGRKVLREDQGLAHHPERGGLERAGHCVLPHEREVNQAVGQALDGFFGGEIQELQPRVGVSFPQVGQGPRLSEVLRQARTELEKLQM